MRNGCVEPEASPSAVKLGDSNAVRGAVGCPESVLPYEVAVVPNRVAVRESTG